MKSASASTPPIGHQSSTWLGHQIVRGPLPFPVFGLIQSETQTFFIAKITTTPASLTFTQTACGIRFSSHLGTQTWMEPHAVLRIPQTHFKLQAAEDHQQWVGQWRAGFDESDWDEDGHPGISIHVRGPLCQGTLFVRGQSMTEGKFTLVSDTEIRGNVTIEGRQHILGATSTCLRWVRSPLKDLQRGEIRYRKAHHDVTCSSYNLGKWPGIISQLDAS